jgi:hypothetical protein
MIIAAAQQIDVVKDARLFLLIGRSRAVLLSTVRVIITLGVIMK